MSAEGEFTPYLLTAEGISVCLHLNLLALYSSTYNTYSGTVPIHRISDDLIQPGSVENEKADAGRDGRTCLAGKKSQARMGIQSVLVGGIIFFLFS